MKKLLFLMCSAIVVIATLSLSSCSNTNRGVVYDSSTIIGTWNDSSYDEYYTFTKDNSCYKYDSYVSSENPPVKGSYTFDGETLKLSMGGKTITYTCTFDLPRVTMVSTSGTLNMISIVAKHTQEELEAMLK